VLDAAGNWVVFKGIGLSCTEYFARPNMPLPAADPEPADGAPLRRARRGRARRLEDWPGEYGWNACFGGAPAPNATLALNDEVANVARLLTGANFATAPGVRKVAWPHPYDEVLSAGSPLAVPIVRIPVTSATYMFDAEANGLGARGYRAIIDMLVTNLTAQGIAVIIDQHEDCASGGRLNCSSRGGPMALRDWGDEANGPVRFWSTVAQKYANNSFVFYELYNEPHAWFQALYGGDPLYVGMSEMYRAVRNQTASGLVIMAGNGWAQDAASLIAASMEFERESGKPLSNVLFNLHPYQGAYQGVWISLRSTLRLTLALQQIGPVIYTELGQYCCNAGPAKTCQSSGMCNDHAHGDHFVHNLLNLAAQVDVSWVGWSCECPGRSAKLPMRARKRTRGRTQRLPTALPPRPGPTQARTRTLTVGHARRPNHTRHRARHQRQWRLVRAGPSGVQLSGHARPWRAADEWEQRRRELGRGVGRLRRRRPRRRARRWRRGEDQRYRLRGRGLPAPALHRPRLRHGRRVRLAPRLQRVGPAVELHVEPEYR
jgi:hypothetical protein